MIMGTGIDIVDSRRIETLLSKYKEKGINRLFSEKEQEKANKRTLKTMTYSKMFAAKEAFIKALGHSYTLTWTDIEILNNDLGKPIIHLSQKGMDVLEEKIGKNTHIHLSMSDDPPFVVAFVIIEHV